MRKIYHVVMPETTVTFLDYEGVQAFLGSKSLHELIENVVVAESEVTDDHYSMLSDWQHRGVIKEAPDGGTYR